MKNSSSIHEKYATRSTIFGNQNHPKSYGKRQASHESNLGILCHDNMKCSIRIIFETGKLQMLPEIRKYRFCIASQKPQLTNNEFFFMPFNCTDSCYEGKSLSSMLIVIEALVMLFVKFQSMYEKFVIYFSTCCAFESSTPTGDAKHKLHCFFADNNQHTARFSFHWKLLGLQTSTKQVKNISTDALSAPLEVFLILFQIQFSQETIQTEQTRTLLLNFSLTSLPSNDGKAISVEEN
ncbi:CLUMA_CG015464, isoform A [Clunio marinus]|uniref:CLUMA_CG015464, isoform A n=1 Tax=Clunio marinus TaxID=568069 RepID=A0A1J1IQN0_9DIPT|nr:CLUMA_CG015464, isoform A [Clunio marinus]